MIKKLEFSATYKFIGKNLNFSKTDGSLGENYDGTFETSKNGDNILLSRIDPSLKSKLK